jgi:hypothetical protein
VYTKQLGSYERIGSQVTIYIDLEFTSQGQTYIGGGGTPTLVGIRGLPFEADTLGGISTQTSVEVEEASWPNGLASPSGVGAPYIATYPYPYNAQIYDKNTQEDMLLWNYSAVAQWFTTNLGSHTYSGKEIAIQGTIQAWIPDLANPPFFVAKVGEEQYGQISNINFVNAAVAYAVKFLFALTYTTNDP